MLNQPVRMGSQRVITQIVMTTTGLLLVGLVVTILSTIMGFRLGKELSRPNPFTGYEMIWPGQSMASLANYAEHNLKHPIDCNSNVEAQNKYSSLSVQVNAHTYGSPSEKTICRIMPTDRVFRWGGVTLDHEQIQELTLFSDVLNQDALFLYWGAPDKIAPSMDPRYVNLTWLRATYTALVTVDLSNFTVKLISITLEATG